MFDNDVAYRTINVHKSAISAYHDPFYGIPVGQSALFCSHLTGIFNNRLPQPRCTFIWDVEKVLNYLNSFLPLKDLSKTELTMKLILMLALTAATQNCSKISYLNIRFMSKADESIFFTLTNEQTLGVEMDHNPF